MASSVLVAAARTNKTQQHERHGSNDRARNFLLHF
jgi:hypothetical protein